MAKAQNISIGPWRFEYGGGRLADVYHVEADTPLDCMQACEYDWTRGEPVDFTRADFRARAREWIRENGQCYIENALPYA